MAAPTSPLATLERCFTSLTAGPDPLAIDGRALRHGLPPRPIPLDERRRLLHQLSPQARAATVNELVHHARTGSPAWLVGLAGVLLPGLRRLAAQHPKVTDTTTAEAQALTWFRTTLAAQGAAADQRIEWLLERTCSTQTQVRHPDGQRHVINSTAACLPATCP